MMLYALDHELFQAFSILFLPIILVQVYLYFSHPNNAFAEVVWLFQMFFWQSLIRRCLHLVVLNKSSLFALMKSSLDCRLWQFLTPISWRVFFNWLDVMKGFFFTMERILRSSTTVVLHGRPGLFMLLSSLVRSLFLRMYQPLDFGHSECSCYLSDRCVLFLKPNNCMSYLYGEIL